MTYNLTPDEKLDRLKSLLEINEKYTISFGKHKGTGILLESRKSKGKDQDKKVKKVDGKLVPCWMFKFDLFTAFIKIQELQDIQITGKGFKLIFLTYVLEIEKCK